MLSLGKGEGTNYSIGIPFIEVGKDNYGKPKQRMIISPLVQNSFVVPPKVWMIILNYAITCQWEDQW